MHPILQEKELLFFDLLFQASGLADPVSQIIQIGSADMRAALNNNFFQPRGPQRERSLYANPIAGDTAHGEVGVVAGIPNADDGAFKFLDTLSVAFFNSNMNIDHITWSQVGNVFVYW